MLTKICPVSAIALTGIQSEEAIHQIGTIFDGKKRRFANEIA
jgi:hypothetical protein